MRNAWEPGGPAPTVALAALSLATLAFSQASDCDSMGQCQEALKSNPAGSLIHFRIGEFYFRDKKLQQSANEFRMGLNGDLEPKWVEEPYTGK